MSAAELYHPSPIKPTCRKRRTSAEVQVICAAIEACLKADHPRTVRAVFYYCESLGLIAKTENEYKNTICRLLLVMRDDGRVPYEYIADATRWMRKPASYRGLEQALALTVQGYRRSIWDEQDVNVEIWCEKDAVAGTIHDVTAEFDVPLMVARGYSSATFLYETAQNIKAAGKPTYIYLFGDHDPSGVDSRRYIEARLREFAPESEIHFETAALTPEQVTKWNLPTRPTKTTDSRSKKFKGESVEIDAIVGHLGSSVLRDIVRDCIERHINPHVLEATRRVEKAERDSLREFLRNMPIGQPAAAATAVEEAEDATELGTVARDRWYAVGGDAVCLPAALLVWHAAPALFEAVCSGEVDIAQACRSVFGGETSLDWCRREARRLGLWGAK